MIKNRSKNEGVLAKANASPYANLCGAGFRFVTIIMLVLIPINTPTRVLAAQNLSYICDQAAAYAANKTGVPLTVLQAISLTETGRNQSGIMRSWPWTVNMEGKGNWFDSEDEARAYVYKSYKRGARSFDVGCFQINYKWHGHEFASIEEMFEPNSNALYAASFLLELYREKGDWSEAAGAYHSRTQKYADKYAKRFDTYRNALLGSKVNTTNLTMTAVATPNIPPPQAARINRFPLLLKNSNTRTLGSLVPLGTQQSTERLIAVDPSDG